MYEDTKRIETKDFKERFEFRLTFGENDTFICQRYFKIWNFNQSSLTSKELVETIQSCANMIDEELKSKSATYLSYMAPQVFQNEKEMFDYCEKHPGKIGLGHGIVLREGTDVNWVMGKNGVPFKSNEKFDLSEYSTINPDDSKVSYKFSFYDDGKLICGATWDGFYPYEVRKSIDLSNDVEKILGGRQITELNLRDYVNYHMAVGRGDLVKKLISEIRSVCTLTPEDYTTKETFGNKEYDYACVRNEVRKMEKELARLEKGL